MSKRLAMHSIGGEVLSIADTASAYSEVRKLDRAQDIKAVTFEAQGAMTDAQDHVVVELYRVRSTTATKIYAYTFAADSVAWTPVTLVVESGTNLDKLLDGDRIFAKVRNETGSAVAPLNWAVHVETSLGLEPATTAMTS